ASISSGTTAHGAQALIASAEGTSTALFRREPFATAHTTGSSRSARTPATCSALSARSSPRTPAVFCVATLVSTDTSSSTDAMSSRRVSRLVGMVGPFDSVARLAAGRYHPVHVHDDPRSTAPPISHPAVPARLRVQNRLRKVAVARRVGERARRARGRHTSVVEGHLADGRRLLLDSRLPARHPAARGRRGGARRPPDPRPRHAPPRPARLCARGRAPA